MFWVILGIITLILIGVIIIYNQLVQSRQLVDNGWSDIEVQLKRRADLIPRLVETVKGYAAHERKLFSDVIEKRNAALAAGDKPTARASAESALQRPVGRLIALAEDYPDLKASDNFLDLQNELSETEDKIEMARRFYNGAVRGLNTKVESVPSNFVAKPFGFSKRDYFEIDETDYAVPEVKL
ncbi:LemA family protein [Litorimonas haliclonae]|uniref:LemA family protein n=1 Tax=Litorimonas haliclonae TaxID=2081977 RepID=UPI0039EFD28E